MTDEQLPASPAPTSVIEQLRASVRASGLLHGGQAVVVMLSGGRDSVCLLDIAAAIRGTEVTALHVNYGLRALADEDERHCRQLCERHAVPLEVLRASRGEQTGNLQAWARQVRYRAAAELAQTLGGVYASGHTATDQVETILYRLAASPGRRALLGMSAREGHLVRPLLAISREQTAAYCRAAGLPWREDESNDSDDYARSRVRHRLVPALRAVHPAAEASVLRTAALLREETELLEELVDRELGGQSSIAVERLANLPNALARLVVVRLAEQAAEDYVPQAGGRVPEIIALASHGGRRELHVGGLISAVVEGGVLRMVKIEPHYPPRRSH